MSDPVAVFSREISKHFGNGSIVTPLETLPDGNRILENYHENCRAAGVKIRKVYCVDTLNPTEPKLLRSEDDAYLAISQSALSHSPEETARRLLDAENVITRDRFLLYAAAVLGGSLLPFGIVKAQGPSTGNSWQERAKSDTGHAAGCVGGVYAAEVVVSALARKIDIEKDHERARVAGYPATVEYVENIRRAAQEKGAHAVRDEKIQALRKQTNEGTLDPNEFLAQAAAIRSAPVELPKPPFWQRIKQTKATLEARLNSLEKKRGQSASQGRD